MKKYGCLALAMTAMSLAAGCGSDTPTPTPTDAGTNDVQGSIDTGVRPTGDVPVSTASGTCASPIDLATAGTMTGTDLVFRGTTAGAADELHPYEGCVMRDASESVLRYRVPSGVQALQITTEGSSFDTAVYVRSACSQAAGGADLACNNDSYDHAPQSTVYVTNAIEGQVLFIVVDGNAAMDTVSSGAFTLTVHPVAFGAQGTPCRLVTDPPTARCDGALRCSEGGGADGTAICVPTVAVSAACDPRFFNNICAEGSTCVTDPAPAEGQPATSVCALPGTRRAAPCRTAEPRCDSPWACSAGDTPSCVPTLAMGIACDPMGEGNRCATGLTCSALGDGGAPLCHN
ncbi:MAG: hypothetical protein JWM10_4606 [Myxococcaceae bacterium]|nr:hypothetical protein [Myxococcaceae bacterium]